MADKQANGHKKGEIYLTEHTRAGDLGDGTYMNPVLSGDYADPSVLRVGEDYYLTHSSFTFAPGMLIWHSKDLVNWRPICKALDSYIGDIWAPDFIEHNGHFYIYVPIDGKIMAITAPSPEGPWSNPVDLGLQAIDPGHVVDKDGNRYLHTGGGYMTKLSDDGLSIAGETIKVYEGWKFPEEWIVEGNFLESPKLFYRNGYYYLTSAQGGSSGPPTSHMVVSARSLTPWGPFENSPYNPIIRTQSREERWYSKGHGTLVDTPDDDWWILFHAYEKGSYTLGRQHYWNRLNGRRTAGSMFPPASLLIGPLKSQLVRWFRMAWYCPMISLPVSWVFNGASINSMITRDTA